MSTEHERACKAYARPTGVMTQEFFDKCNEKPKIDVLPVSNINWPLFAAVILLALVVAGVVIYAAR